ncbi:TraB/GumN family protein [Sphingopyxis granuli]|uniref:TraB/GumN family protein n=1 Tax=Sphingopyxis granuli TaxID=267128 RepID=UPI00082BD6CA|nr:TraB/GumN family protein [Sphingopyxis granuli]
MTRRRWHRRRGGRAAAALAFLLFVGCGSAEPPREARPAMWLVADPDTRIYLLGTMHALPRGTDWDGGKVAEAMRAADALVMELSPDELAAAGAVFGQLAPRSAPLAIDRRLSGEALGGYRRLEAKGGDFGGDRLDDWAVMVLMGQRTAALAKLSPDAGVEAGLTAAFRDADKPIGGLETAKAQLLLFETLPPEAQRTLLERAASRADSAPREVGALADAWSRGDVAALEAVINADVEAVPAARKAILTDRNRRWSAWVKRRMDRPGTLLVAVGAGHLIGPEGVPALLEADGLTVTRVQ